MTRISSLDTGYRTGDLSLFPHAQDNKSQLYVAKNFSQTVLTQSLTYAGKYIIVSDTSLFPDTGLLRIGPPAGQSGNSELIYYAAKTSSQFQQLQRGFAGSIQTVWPSGSYVSSGVMAESHNTIKDAVQQIEVEIGTTPFPNTASLNGILKSLEVKFLAPKPLFRAYPLSGAPPLRVRFQNFSNRGEVRYLWDFGDGTTSVETSPIHTYQNEGVFSVNMNLITQTGATGSVTKSNYITVSNDAKSTILLMSRLSRATPLSSCPAVRRYANRTLNMLTKQMAMLFKDTGFLMTAKVRLFPTQTTTRLATYIKTQAAMSHRCLLYLPTRNSHEYF